LRARAMLCVVLVGAVCLGVAGCGSARRGARTDVQSLLIPATPAPPSRWPADGDYQAIAVAAHVRLDALRLGWRQKQYAAYLALFTLETLHPMLPGPCATFAAHIYAELLDLHAAYQGEDWRPMVAVVRHDPSVASVCKPPPQPHIAIGA
jgi:hypothetical protein